MRITLVQVEAFYWAARLGGFHAAARHLHLTQPAISARIRELESILEVPLFERAKQRVSLTAAGHNALRHAEKMLSNSRQLERFGKDQKLAGLLRLGADECSALVGLSDLIAQLKDRYPSVTLELTVDVGSVLNQKLNAKELDIALLTNPISGPDVTDEFIGWMRFHWVASPSLNIPEGEFLPEHAGMHHIVTHSPPSTLHAVVKKWLSDGEVELEGFSSCNSLTLMSKLVAAGHAIGILPTPIIRDLLAMGQLRALSPNPPIPPARFYISYLTEATGGRVEPIIQLMRSTLLASNFLAISHEESAGSAAYSGFPTAFTFPGLRL